MVFVRGSYEPLLSSNYYALASLNHLTPARLWRNQGFRLSLVLIGIFVIFLVLTKVTEEDLSFKEKMMLLKSELAKENPQPNHKPGGARY